MSTPRRHSWYALISVLCVLTSAFCGSVVEGAIYYVRPDGSNSNAGSGASSTQAWQTIEHALTSSLVAAGDTIYVMSGTYTEEIAPTRSGASSSPIQVIADRDGAIFGGGGGDVNILAPSSVSVFDLEFDNYLTFNGFRLQGSGTDTVFLSDCNGIVFYACEIYDGDNGFNIAGSSTVTLINCLIRNNSDDGIELNGGTTTIYNCTIVDNNDSGVRAHDESATVVNCIIADNDGYGFIRQSDGDGVFQNFFNLLYNNSSGNYDGATVGIGEITSDPQFIGSGDYRLQSGSPAIDAGGDLSGTVDDDLVGVPRPIGSSHDMGAYEKAGTVYYVRPDGNDSNSGDGPDAGDAWATLTHATTESLSPGDTVYVHPGAYSGRLTPSVDGTASAPIRFIADRDGAVTGWPGGEVTVQPAVGDVILDTSGDNYLEFYGFNFVGNANDTGLYFNGSAGMRVERCVVSGAGNAVWTLNGADVTVVNCLLHSNTYNAVVAAVGTTTVLNCTIANNSPSTGYNAVFVDGGTATVTNCVIANNGDGLSFSSGTLTNTYNLVYGHGADYEGGAAAGVGEINTDPLFANSTTFHLQDGSPAIDSGTNLAGQVDEDFADQTRPLNVSWDMGCYEGTGLLGHWDFDDGTGTTITDSSAYGNDATFNVGTPAWVSGVRGTALEFDGASDAVTGSNFTPPRRGTVALWWRSDGPPTSRQRPWGVGADFEMWQDTDGLVSLDLNGDGLVGGNITNDPLYASGRWYHIVGMFDVATDAYEIYINGKLHKSGISTANLTEQAANLLTFGTRTGSTQRFTGEIDDFRVYNYWISPAQVAELYGLVGHWRLDETSGTVAVDSSGKGNDGNHSGVTVNSPGPFPGRGAVAAAYDGLDDITQTTADFEPPSTGAVAFWMRGMGTPAVRQRLLGVNGDWEVRQETNGRLAFDLGASPIVGNEPFMTPDPIDVDGRWYHVTANFNDADDSFEIYVDGQLVHTGTSAVDLVAQSAGVLSIGTRTGNGEYWNGGMYDLRIYNRQLKHAEIADLYGLVAWWKLDENSGGVAFDSSGMAHDAVLTGIESWTAGKIDGGHAFDYTNGEDYFTAPSTTVLDNLQEDDYSVVAWFRPLSIPPGTGSDNDAAYAPLSKNGYNLGIVFSDSSQFHNEHWHASGPTWVGAGTWADTYPAGTFYHVAAAVSIVEGWTRIYVDGELKDEVTFTPGEPAYEFGSNPWRIGISEPGGGSWGHPTHGVIDDARLYRRAITPEEASRLFSEGAAQGLRIMRWVEVK